MRSDIRTAGIVVTAAVVTGMLGFASAVELRGTHGGLEQPASSARAKRAESDDQASKSTALLRPANPESERIMEDFATLGEVSQAVSFTPLIPDSIDAGEMRLALFGRDASAPGLIIESSRMLIAQEPVASELSESAYLDETAIPGVGFDDRFMRRVTVRGCTGVAWNPVDIGEPVPGGTRTAQRAGVVVPYAGVVWIEDGVHFRILSNAKTGDYAELITAAESMRPIAK